MFRRPFAGYSSYDLFIAAEYDFGCLDGYADCTADEDQVGCCAYPAQGVEDFHLQEFFATGIPQTMSDGGVCLNRADRQQADGDHADQAAVEQPEAPSHEFVVEFCIWFQVAGNQ